MINQFIRFLTQLMADLESFANDGHAEIDYIRRDLRIKQFFDVLWFHYNFHN